MTILQFGRPTTYKGIEMRSRLEAAVAGELDRRGHEWSYEPRCFADETGQYLPDFVVEIGGRDVYLELKGTIPDEVALAAIEERMEIIWSSAPDATLMLWEDFPAKRVWMARKKTGWWQA